MYKRQGRKVQQAINEARTTLRTGNIGLNGSINIGHGGVVMSGQGDKGDARPRGEITPAGELLVDGRKVEVTPEQHALLVDYRNELLGVAEAGMAMGVAGAELGGKALSGVAGAIFGGKQAQAEFDARMKAEGERLDAEGRKLCERMRPLYARQQALAAALPAFKPYATMTAEDADKCLKDGKFGKVTGIGSGVAIPDAERERIRAEIREEVRAEVRRERQGANAPAR